MKEAERREARDYDLLAKLQVIGTNIINMEAPHGVKQTQAVAQARKYAAQELHKLGYSHRQIMMALGLKSPQSVSEYLKPPELSPQPNIWEFRPKEDAPGSQGNGTKLPSERNASQQASPKEH